MMDDLFNRIVSGRIIVEINNTVYIVYDANINQKQLADIKYEEAYNNAITNKIPTEDQADAILLEKGLWNPLLEKEVTDLNNNVKILGKELLSTEFQSNKKKMLSDAIDISKKRIAQITKQKNSLYGITAEHSANLTKYKYLLFLCTKTHDDKTMWTNWNKFLKVDEHIINKLLSQTFFNKDIDETSIRKLARSEPWRSSWVAAIKTGNLFTVPTTHMTDLQHAIVSWSLIYDSVYENTNCPSDEVINDDKQLDQWLILQSERRKNKQLEDAASNIVSTDPKIQNAGEVGIMVDSVEDAKKVYKLNDTTTQNTLKLRNKMLEEKGIVSEMDMPDTKQKIDLIKHQIEAQKGRG